MNIRDDLGLPLTGADADALADYRHALRQFQCYIEDPVASVDAALARRPDFVMAHVLKAWLHLLGTEPAAIAVARDCHAAAARLPASARERGHLAAIGALLEGRWRRAGRILEDVAIDHPADVLALQAGHLVDFYVGDARMLRDRIARALPAWSTSMAGHHALLGMHAFGLEETGDYARAEAQGRIAVEREPRDGWAWHAVTHVMEMQGREREGIAWLRADPAGWSADSFFQVHNWWHLALFHLELGEIDEVLALFDGPIHGARSTVALDLVDAASLLWRLQLRGTDLGVRWQTVADGWTPLAGAGNYAFNDLHAAMAFVGAGRADALEAVISAQQAAMAGEGDNAAFTRAVGHPLVLAIRDFGAGRYAECAERIRDVRGIAHRFGGSHAQRSVLDLTLLEAALRGGQQALARALAAERLALRPHSPLSRLFLERARPLAAAA
ncbi:tetratricopeptide repeat protein [Thauera phenolivorans]|uniref:tetratricopeptide repeat protein n=1 Tax=Thauera phenolivorans TaxID=1792543 RepID=UPI00083B8547|nr:tetratricopeptide repeat protein [Thauera phenolivorans]